MWLLACVSLYLSVEVVFLGRPSHEESWIIRRVTSQIKISKFTLLSFYAHTHQHRVEAIDSMRQNSYQDSPISLHKKKRFAHIRNSEGPCVFIFSNNDSSNDFWIIGHAWPPKNWVRDEFIGATIMLIVAVSAHLKMIGVHCLRMNKDVQDEGTFLACIIDTSFFHKQKRTIDAAD